MTDDPQHLDARSRSVLFVLAFVGGFADAGSYVLIGSFTGHLTGNMVLMTIHLTSKDWVKASTCLLAVVTFAIGTALGSRAHGGAVPAGSGLGYLRRPLLIEFLLIATALASAKLLGPDRGNPPFVGWLGLALGLQNGSLQQLGFLGVHTTYITGVSTSLIGAAVAGPRARSRRYELAGLIGAFTCGASCGGALVARGGSGGFAFLSLPIVLVFLLSREQVAS